MDSLKGTPLKKLGDFAETDSEIQFLENLFNEDCKCESAHVKVATEDCSIAATHRALQTCKSPYGWNICMNLAQADFQYIASGRHCGVCKRPASDCWIITPI